MLIDRVMPAFEVLRRFGIRLLPCPFCGSENIGIYIGPHPHITCKDCHADGPLDYRSGGRDDVEYMQVRAIESWNVRVTRG